VGDFASRATEEDEMASNEQERTQILERPTREIAPRDTGFFPVLRMPKPEIDDRGIVALGCCCITGKFPTYR
jgi:hypothetical protein